MKTFGDALLNAAIDAYNAIPHTEEMFSSDWEPEININGE